MLRPALSRSVTLSTLTIFILHTCLYASIYASTAFQPVFPGSSWEMASPSEMGMDSEKLDQAIRYAGGSGYIIRSGKVVKAWGDPKALYPLRSTTKSVGSIAFALAVGDGLLSLDDFAILKHPSFGVPPNANLTTGWLPQITLRHLAAHTSGFDEPPDNNSLIFQPGTQWHYSNSGTNWLAEITTLAFRRDLNSVLFNRVFTPIGIRSDDLTWRRHQYRATTINGIPNREFASGINANVDALARIGYLFLREGNWNGQQLIPESYINMARLPLIGVYGLPEHNNCAAYNASDHYGLLWWNNADATLPEVPRDTYWSWGLNESLIVIYPSLDVVAARAGEALQNGWSPDYAVVRPFIENIALSVTDRPATTVSRTMPEGAVTTIDIYAAPVGSPKMELWIQDQPVQSFHVAGGDHTTCNFLKYSYTTSDNIPVNQIKVAFVNDSRTNDLVVDKIVVNGIPYESESPDTFNTGAYVDGDCRSRGGYYQREMLSCNGYLRYG